MLNPCIKTGHTLTILKLLTHECGMIFPLFRFSLISFNKCFVVVEYKFCIFLVKLIPIYFILFDAIAKGTAFHFLLMLIYLDLFLPFHDLLSMCSVSFLSLCGFFFGTKYFLISI